MIAIDGGVSDFSRPLHNLFGESVPIIVQSEYSPLFVESWVAYEHYVPVQSDLSDLVS